MRGCLLAALLVGCGGSSDLTGLYQTTYQTSSPSCTEGPQMIQKPFFQITTEKVLSFDVPVFHFCDSMDTATCTGVLAGVQITGTDRPGYEAIAIQSPGCTLEYDQTVAMLSDNSLSIRVERHRQDDPSLDATTCTSQEAQKRGTSMPCVGLDVVRGTRLR